MREILRHPMADQETLVMRQHDRLTLHDSQGMPTNDLVSLLGRGMLVIALDMLVVFSAAPASDIPTDP
jgi:hypothetical protein